MDLLVPGSLSTGKIVCCRGHGPPGAATAPPPPRTGALGGISANVLVQPTCSQVPLGPGQCFPCTVLSSWQVSLGAPHSPPLCPHFTAPVSCSGQHAGCSLCVPRKPGWCPSRPSTMDVRVCREGIGDRQLRPPCPDPPCCVLRVSSAPRHGNDCQLILHYFSDADQLLNCCK